MYEGFPTLEKWSKAERKMWILYVGDSRANRSLRPGSAKARRMTVISGRRCCALLESLGHNMSLVRTLLESSRWNSTVCFLTWKVKATPSNRLLFQLAPSMTDTDETEFGLWATPESSQRGGRSNDIINGNKVMSRTTGERMHGLDLNCQVKMWPTPHGFSKDG